MLVFSLNMKAKQGKISLSQHHHWKTKSSQHKEAYSMADSNVQSAFKNTFTLLYNIDIIHRICMLYELYRVQTNF